MRKKRRLYILLAVAVLAVSLLTVSALADAGNFSGGSDYGGGSSGGSSSDWGSDSGGVVVSGPLGTGLTIVVFAIFGVAFVYAYINSKKAGSGPGSVTGEINLSDLSPMSSLIEKDPNFSESDMRDKISNLYVRMQNAWQDKNFEPMRPYMTDALYNQFSLQLDGLIRANQTNYVERIAVLDVSLNGWKESEANDALVATVSTRIVDYNVDDKTGKVVSGSKTAEKFMTYQWTLVRSSGMTTPERAGSGSEGTSEVSCPSCGAPVEINQSAKCPYCGSIINAKDYDWSISAIKGISQRTVGK